MNQFKAGDKVITTQQGGWYEPGEIYTLTEQYQDKGWFVEEKDGGYFLNVGKFRLFTPKEILKNGMRVKCRNRSMWTYIDGYFTQIGEGTPRLSYLNTIESWADDLSPFNDKQSEWVVVEISKAPHISIYFDYTKVTPVIWKREEKSEVEKQLEEIQATIESLTKQVIELEEQIEQEKL